MPAASTDAPMTTTVAGSHLSVAGRRSATRVQLTAKRHRSSARLERRELRLHRAPPLLAARRQLSHGPAEEAVGAHPALRAGRGAACGRAREVCCATSAAARAPAAVSR